ncbi:MAG: transglutaminase family protein [Candidatus Dormibacteraeota bacterium]|nr:transglutaminase family protein [Candidatus Dormibacteraeota bacterium]
MTRYEVVHTTAYRYSGKVRESHMELRLRPIDGQGQRLVQHRLEIRPEVRPLTYRDGFGNTVHTFSLLPVHDHLDIVSRAVVETGLTPDVPAADEVFPHDLLLFRPPIVAAPGVQTLARRAGLQEPPTAEAVDAAMRRLVEAVAHDFTYNPAATTVTTAVDDVLRLRSGVCQDFAHLMIAVSRALGVPARYVSGYVYAGSGEPLIGASHAWMEAWTAERGWLAYDATHPGLRLERYVRVAVGRDYRDAAPTRGVYLGAVTGRMRVEVETRPLGDASGRGPARARSGIGQG